jgi:hypothetical protein
MLGSEDLLVFLILSRVVSRDSSTTVGMILVNLVILSAAEGSPSDSPGFESGQRQQIPPLGAE